MSQDKNRRWRCKECNEISLGTSLLIAPNPFDQSDTIYGCPLCRAVSGFTEVCDEAGCDDHATCGFPVIGGYRRTCHKHYQRPTTGA